MLSRNKLLLSLVVPTVAVFIFAILWRRKNTDTPSSENKQENMAGESQGNGNETSKQQSETPCSESRITSNDQHEKENGEQVNLDLDLESQHINGQNINEIDLEEQEDMGEEDICAELEYDNNGDPKELETTSDSKMICDRQEGKKTSWSTIDSGVELTKQPSFELKDYWLGEETLSEGSGDSVALSGYTEPPLENYLASGCEITESEKTVWEVEFPQILCGRLIGRKGKNVKVISDCSGAKIRLIPQSPGEVSTHRIISISGECSQIKSALDSIHEKFPAVSLNRINTTASLMQQSLISPVVPTLPIATPVPYVQTVLPNITNFSVVVTSVLDGNHFFIQLHNDALQAQLQQLHQTMLQCYGQGSGGPLALPLPNPIIVGSYCAAPAFTYDGWYRAQVLGPTGNGDEVQVKYLDYGGYGRIVASSLRQLRSDFLSYLPFQAVECYLSNVAPLNGDGFSLVASAVLEDLTMNSVLTARVVGHRNQLPCLELYLVQGQQTIMINRELVNRGLARWVESRSVLVT